MQAQRAQLTAARAAVVANAQEAEEWGHVTDACDIAVRDILDGGVGNFCARVQRALPATDTFDLTLREGTREVFAFGLLRDRAGCSVSRGAQDAVLHTALSGAEWARVTAAMASAITPASSRFAMLIPEDRAFDPATLAVTMRALTTVPWQIVWASPVRPAGRLPGGWTLVEAPRVGGAPAAEDDLTYTDGNTPAGVSPEVAVGDAPAPNGLDGLILA